MSKKRNNQRKPNSPSAETEEHGDPLKTISLSVLQDLLKPRQKTPFVKVISPS